MPDGFEITHGPNTPFEEGRNAIQFPDPQIPTVKPMGGTITNAEWATSNVDAAEMALYEAGAKIMNTPSLNKPGTASVVSPNAIDISGRYPFQRVGFDNEELYAQGQKWYSKAGNSIVKGLGLAGTTLLNGTLGLLWGTGKFLADGKFSSFYNNEFTQSMDKFNSDLENTMPNYYTHAELDADWYSPSNLLTANFIFDKVIKNLGFAAGAALTGRLIMGGLQAVGNIAGLSASGRLVNALEATEKSLQGMDKAERFASLSRTLSEEARRGVTAYANMNKAQRALVAGLSTVGEAGMEAINTSNEFRNNMIKEFRVKNERDPNDEEMEKINRYADNAGNADFLLNTAILSATNYVQFPKILGSSYKAERNLLTKSAERVIEKDGKYVIGQPTTRAGRVLASMKNVSKYFFNPIEGAEEGLQFAAQTGSENYYNKQFNGENATVLDDLFGYGFGQTFNTKEGIENILIGGLSGAIMTARGEYREAKEDRAFNDSAVSAFNQRYLKSYLKDTVAAANRAATLQSEREEAIRRGDTLASKDLEHDYAFNYVLPRVKHGRLDLVKSDIDKMLSLASTPQGLQELKQDGIIGGEESLLAVTGRLNNLKKMADDVNNLWQGLTIKYSPLVDADGNRVYTDDVIEKMVYAGTKVSDYDRRLTQLSSEMLTQGINPDESALRSMRWKEVDDQWSEDNPVTKPIVDTLKQIDELDVVDETKDDLKSAFSDYFEIILRRRDIMDEYTDIKNNPNKYKTSVAPTATAAEAGAQTGTVKVTTADGEEDLELGTEYYLGNTVRYTKEGKAVHLFPRMTILSVNPDGSLRVRASNGNIRNISKEELAGYKLGKVSDTDSNPKAKFVMENYNTPWFFNFGAKNGGKVEGHLEYSPKEGILNFVYKDKYGKTRRIEVTNKDFSKELAQKKGFNEPKLTPGRALSPSQTYSLEQYKAFNDSVRQRAKAEFKVKVLSDLTNEKREQINKLDKRISEQQDRLEEAKIELADTRAEIEKFTEETAIGTKNRKFRKQFRQLIDLADDLSRETRNLEDDIRDLQQSKNDLQLELNDLNDILADNDALEEGELLLEQLLAMRFDLESINDGIEDEMKFLASFLKDVQATLDDVIDFIFAGKNAEYYGITPEDLNLLKTSPSYLQFVRDNPLLFNKLREALGRISLVEAKINTAQSTIEDIEGKLDSLAKKYATNKRQIEMFEKLFNTFDQKAKEWAEEQRQLKLLEQSEEYKKRIFEQMKASEATSGDNATGDPSIDRSKYADEQDRKKNISHFFISGTEPRYEAKGLENDDFHRRHQRFLENLIKGKVKNPQNIRIIPITYNNQDSFGLPGFIKADNKEAIRLVYVKDTFDEGYSLIDENGEFIDGDASKIIYSNLPTEELVDTGNRLRYNNKNNLSAAQIKDMQEQWKKSRKTILGYSTKESTPMWSFAVSRGIEQTSNKENAVIETKVIDEADMDKPIISVSTTGFIEIRPAGDIEGIEDAVAVPLGRPMLNINAGLSFLNNANLSNDQQNDIFGLLKFFARTVADRAIKGQKEGLLGSVEVNGENIDIVKYLQNVLHWKIPAEGKKPGRNQIWIQDGRLYMGSNKEFVAFTPRSLESNAAKVMAFLSGTYHNVNNAPLNDIEQGKASQFIELGVNKNGEPIIKRAWKNYNHYLLSNKNPDGSKRTPILTTRLIIPQKPEELQFVQRYPIVKMDDLAPKARKVESKKKEAPKPAPKKDDGKKKPVKKVAPEDEEIDIEDLPEGDLEEGSLIEQMESGAFLEAKKTPETFEFKTAAGGTITYTTSEAEFIAAATSGDPGTAFTIESIVDKEGKDITDSVLEDAAKIEAMTKLLTSEYKKTLKARESKKPSGPKRGTSKAKIEVKAPTNSKAKSDLEEADDSVDESAFRELKPENYLGGLGSNMYDMEETTAEQIKAEETWFRARFPNIDYHTTKRLITTSVGTKAWGMFKDAAVYIYENAERGTTYHEAFEAVWNSFATQEEKKAMIDEFRSRIGTFRNFKGELVSFKDASYHDAKEQMAEEFRDWKLNGNPPVKGQPKKMGFFKRLWNFIKDFIFGKPADIAETFQRIEQGYYMHMAPKTRSHGPQYREVSQAPEVQIQDMLEGMTVEFFSEVFETDEAIVVAMEENPELATGTIYGKLYNRLQNWFEGKSGLAAYYKGLIKAHPELTTEYTNQYNDIRYGNGLDGNAFGWEFVKANWGDYVKEHSKYLRRYGIELEEASEGVEIDELVSIDEADQKNQVEYERDVLTISAKNAASKSIKFMFSTIAESEFTDSTAGYQAQRALSTLKLQKQANYTKLFSYVMHTLAGRNTIYNMQKVLTETSANKKIKQNANVKRVQARLKWENFASKTINQMKILLKFENVFAKFKPTFSAQRVDFSGNNYTVNANTNTKVEQVINTWLNHFRRAKFVSVKQGKYYVGAVPGVNANDIPGRLKFLESAFGIKITQQQYNDLPASSKEKLKEAINGGQFAVKSIMNKPLGSLSDRAIGLGARINKLAEVVVTNFTGNDLESQHLSIAGKAITNFVMHNYVSLTISDLNDVKTRDEFLRLNPHLNDIYSQESQLLKKDGILFDANGNVRAIKPTVNIPEGRIDEATGKKVPVDKLGLGERVLYEINENLNGRYYILLPADSKTEWSINLGTYLNSSDFFQYKGPQIQKFTAIMRNYLKNEIELARDYDRRKDVAQLSKTDEATKRPIGKNLRFFKDILTPEQVEIIHKRVIDKDVDLFTAIPEDAINQQILNFINDKIQSQRKTLESDRIIEQYEEGIEFYGLSKEWLKQHFNKTGNFTNSEIDSILQFRTMNYVINNIEMHKMFFMDPASYKDATKRIKSFLSGREYSHVDPDGKNFNRWANEQLNKAGDIALRPSDRGYHNFTNHMKTYTVRDVNVQSAHIETIKKALKDSSAYENINETDAQSLATLPAYREMLFKAGGRWTTAQERQYQYEMAYERNALSKKGVYTYSSTKLASQDEQTLAKGNPGVAIFHTLKPIHSGPQYRDGVAIASLDKTSMMPMFYRLVEGRQMENLYNQMVKNGVHYVRYESAHKVGIQKSSTVDLYNEDGTVADHSKTSYEYVPYKYYGIQVETAGKKEAQTRGTQLTKLAVNNLFKDGEPVGDTEERKEHIRNLVNQHTEVLSELAYRGYNKILSKLGIVEGEDGSFTYADKQKVADFILKEIESRELAENLSNGVKINPETGDFVLPLEALSNYRAIRNILYSIIEKNITRPKMSGSPKVQVSTALFEKNPRMQARKDKNGKIFYVSNELAFYDVGKDGKTTACEILLPHWFGAKLRAAKSTRTDQEILTYLNSTEEGKNLLRGIGFRIPTDEVHAAEYFIVKGFLPQEFGDTVVLPSEITAKAGSDFDIDKLNLYLKNFYINKQGFPQAIKFIDIDTNDEKQLRDLYEKKYSKYIGKLGSIEKDYATEKATNKFTNAILEQMRAQELANAESEDEIEDINSEYDDIIAENSQQGELKIPTVEEFILENKGKDVYELNSREAVENRYYETLEELLSLPENYAQLIRPTSADNIKSAAEFVKDVKNVPKDTGGLDYTKLLDPDWMARERHKFIIGKGGVGIAAVSQTNIAMNQISGISIKGIVPKFPHNKLSDGSVSVSALTDTGGVPLSAKNSGYTNGYVDVAKGADIIDMGAELSVASTMMLMEKMGIPNDAKNGFYVSLFIAQPAIQEYLKQDSLVKSASAMNPYIMKEYLSHFGSHPVRLTAMVNEKFPGTPGKSNNRPFDYKKMEAVARKFYRGGTLTEQENAEQMEMLAHFIEIRKTAGDFFQLIMGYNYDTSRFRDPNAVYRKELQYQKAQELETVNSIDKVMTRTFEGAVKEVINKSDDALSDVFRLHRGRAKMSINQMVKDINNLRGLNRDDKERIANQAEMSLLNYIIQTKGIISKQEINSYINSVMLSNFSAADQLDSLKEQLNRTNSAGNRMVENLQPNIDPDTSRPSTIKIIEKDTDSYTSNMYTSSFRELKVDHSIVNLSTNVQRSVADIYRNIVVSQILQNGSLTTPYSFNHLIPVEDYAEIVNTGIQNMNKVNFDFFDDEKAFYRNQWNNKDVVPEAKKSTESEFFAQDPINPREYLPSFKQSQIAPLLDEAGIKNSNNYRILRLSGFAASYAPVIKETVDRINPETGKLFTPQQKAEMRKKGDYSYRQVKLYKRVEINGEPATTQKKYQGGVSTQFIYKPINAWGDGANLQEYYDYPRKSAVGTNLAVQELSDEQIVGLLERAGYSILTANPEDIVDETEETTTPTEEDTTSKEDESDAKKKLGLKKGDCK